MKQLLVAGGLLCSCGAMAQQNLSPEQMWQLGRVSGMGVSKDKQFVVYKVGTPNMAQNKITSKTYKIPVGGGAAVEITNADELLADNRTSPKGDYIIKSEAVKIEKVFGSDYYPELKKSTVQIYDSLNYRHWDAWEDGTHNHVILQSFNRSNPNIKPAAADIMQGEPYDCPTKPFGGDEDFIWSPDGKKIVYVCKKKSGTAYALSTNTDLYEYDLATGTTRNITEDNKGYDLAPAFNAKGDLAWLAMKRDGYEADKQDLIVWNGTSKINLTLQRDDINVEEFKWSDDGKTIFFTAPINGTQHLFSVVYPGVTKMQPVIKQITKGDFDISSIVGQVGNSLIVGKNDMNHAPELYKVDVTSGQLTQLTQVNDAAYKNIAVCKTERRFVTTTDNKQMLVWVVYPPGFDKTKKYPTLLYCQGGPQSALTQSYSFRWNFQLMASQGYVIVAPNRRGMPGHGTEWNEQISKDWGGQVMNDYYSAIDELSKESFVDKNRLGAIGASFGGFSVFALAGSHNGRFKTFISHDGIFDFRSMYGTTEEMWFENWEKGGAYWEKENAVAQRSFDVSPSNFVDKWNTPIMIVQGGKDYRVPISQGQQAFQAAQLKGIKSRFLYFPDENHWVLKPQNGLVWQHEFYRWLDETLK